jgi:hypothetical protein
MKKQLILFFTFCLIFAFAACNNSTNESADSVTQAPEEAAPSGTDDTKSSDLLSGPYVTLMQSGRYYMEFMTYGMEVEVSTSIAVDGADSDTRSEIMGQTSRALILDDILYTINETAQTYTVTPYNIDTRDTLSVNTDYTLMTFTKKSNGPIPGFEDIDNASYNYDEYTIPADSDNGSSAITLRYYIKNDALYAIYMSTMDVDTVMQIITLSDEIPEGMLKLPEDYTQVFIYY